MIETWGSLGGNWTILVHGGAGSAPHDQRERRMEGCRTAVREAARILEGGGTALDSAQRAVEILEDDPQFNAGTGACLTSEGAIELDASLMEGGSLRAGGVCAMPPFLHPIAIARAVLDDGGHILYAAQGAEQFAIARGFERVTDAIMTTPAVRARWEQLKNAGGIVDHTSWDRHGTVGAVARDSHGTVAAATSTGGQMFKRPGRVGDSPILGAGTYADNQAGACSSTGYGEAILQVCLAKTAVEWMRSRMHPEDAARASIRLMLERTHGTGGIILVDGEGRLGLARTTESMAWAAMWDTAKDGEPASGF